MLDGFNEVQTAKSICFKHDLEVTFLDRLLARGRLSAAKWVKLRTHVAHIIWLATGVHEFTQSLYHLPFVKLQLEPY